MFVRVLVVSSIAVGTCLAQSIGVVGDRGTNAVVQLGNGASVDSPTPVQALNLSGVASVSIGGSQTLAVKTDGTVWAWGNNRYGRLGIGVTSSCPLGAICPSDASAPVQLPGITQIVAVSAGNDFGLALKSDGTVWAWGANTFGNLGDGTTEGKNAPVQVSGLSHVAAISAGFGHGLALKSDGTVWAWGNNVSGQVGQAASTAPVKSPVQVGGLSNVIAVAAGGLHSLALKSDGTVWAWGQALYGQLGNNSQFESSTPVQASPLSGVTSIAAGGYQSAARTSDGSVYAWGLNYWRTSPASFATYLVPTVVAGIRGVSTIAASRTAMIALKIDGTVWTLGPAGGQVLTRATVLGQAGWTENFAAIALAAPLPPSPGDVIVIDPLAGSKGGAALIRVIPPSGVRVLISDFDDPAYGPAGTNPVDVAVAADGSIYVADTTYPTPIGENCCGRIFKVDPSTGVRTVFSDFNSGPEHPVSIAIAADGSLYATTTTPPSLIHIDAAGNRSLARDLSPYAGNSPRAVRNFAGSQVVVFPQGGTNPAYSPPSNCAPFCLGSLIQMTPTTLITDFGRADLEATPTNGAGPVSLAIESTGNLLTGAFNGGTCHGSGIDHCSALYRVDPSTGIRTLLSDSSNHSQDPPGLTSAPGFLATGGNPYGLAVHPTLGILAANCSTLTFTGRMVTSICTVDPMTGQRSIFSDFNNPAQGIGYSGPIAIAVVPAASAVLVSIAVTPNPASVNEGNTRQFTATGTYSDGSTANITGSVTWSTSAPAIATITAGGLATGVAAGGPVTISATSGAVSGMASLTVVGLASISVTPVSASIAAGATKQFAATGTYTDGSTGNLTTIAAWSSLDTSIATISAAGLARGVKAGGPVGIQASFGGFTSNTAQLTVTAPALVSISVTPLSATIAAGNTQQFTATGNYTDGSTQNLTSTATWTSTDTTIATISAAGLATGVKAGGPVTIRAALGGITSNGAQLTVTAPALVSIAVTPATASVVLRKLAAFTAIATYSDGSTLDVTTTATWSSSNVLFASVGTTGLAWGRIVGGPVQIFATVGAVSSNKALLTIVAPPSGAVLGWGLNQYETLGNGNKDGSPRPIPAAGLTGVIAVRGSIQHTLALKSDGTVWAWGNNGDLIGNGSLVDSAVPERAAGLNSVVAIAGGETHSLAVKGDGTVWAWGFSSHGQLGRPDILDTDVPAQVTGISAVVDVAAGTAHSVALKADGTVWAWGYNGWGQLGDGSNTDRGTPVQVTGLSGVVAVAAGYYFSMALKSDGTVWAWGQGTAGELGNGGNSNQNVPVQVSGLTRVVKIAAGSVDALALRADGTVWAWGLNSFGEFGNGTTNGSNVPVRIDGLAGVVDLAAGDGHSLGLKPDGTVLAWGYNANGQLGTGDNNDSHVPISVAGVSGVVSMAGGPDARDSFVVTTARTLMSIGVTPYSALLQPGQTRPFTATGTYSDGSSQDLTASVAWTVSDTSVAAFGGANVLNAIKAGSARLRASYGGMMSGIAQVTVAPSGILFGWGDNSSGQLLGANPRLPLAQVSGVAAAAGGEYHTLALGVDGTIRAWGYNGNGQLGDGTKINSSVPVAVSGLSGVTAVAGGDLFSLALKSDGTVWEWGFVSGAASSTTPVQVSGLTGVVAISAEGNSGLALKSDGTVWEWSSGAAVQTVGLTGVAAIAAGHFHNLALRWDGTVAAWGSDNVYGELGNGTNVVVPEPEPVPGLNGVVAIGARGATSVALKADGTVWDWGANDYGQCGVGDLVNRNFPVQVTGLIGVVAIGGGRSHNLALKADGTVWGWGRSDLGQVGDGASTLHQLVVLNGVSFLAGNSPLAQHSLAVANPILQASLGTSVSPAGAGTISGGGTYTPGSNVTVTAAANPGYVFTGFSGALSGSTNPQTLTVYFSVPVVANFAPVRPALTASGGVHVDGDGIVRFVPFTLLNSGTGAAINTTMTSITNITTVTGSGTVTLASLLPWNMGTIVPGGSATLYVGFNWPLSALRVRFTVNYTADGGYSGSTTITTFR